MNLIRVLGSHLSRHSFLQSLTGNVFNATTTENVLEQVNQAFVQLQRTDVFKDVQLYVDTKTKETVDMTVVLKEKDKGFLKSNVITKDNQAELVNYLFTGTYTNNEQKSGGLGIRNIFGGGESVYSSFSYGNYTSAAAEVILKTHIQKDFNLYVWV